MIYEYLKNDVLLGVSHDFAYFLRAGPVDISKLHSPFLLVLGGEKERKQILDLWNRYKTNKENILSNIKDIKDLEEYKSFWNPSKVQNVFKVETYESYLVPEVSNYIFSEFGIPTAEHDIPYVNRALVDFAVDNLWLFDTKGHEERLNILVYDIEISNYGKDQAGMQPIDIIGYSEFGISFKSDKDLENEDFFFNITDMPDNWEGLEIKQLISNNEDEELENFVIFLKEIMSHDIIAGHNILNFDNINIYNRAEYLNNKNKDGLSSDEKKLFIDFLTKYARKERIFNFGSIQGSVNLYPTSFDTYYAVRKFFPNLDSYGLKYLAPFFGIKIEDRTYLNHNEIALNEITFKYNRDDIAEQNGITLLLLQQALPLAFLTGLPFEILLPAGTTKIWDHMAMIRAAKYKKIFPATCRVSTVSRQLLNDFGLNKVRKSKEEIFKEARDKKNKDDLKESLRVIKYGEEMPDWVEYPYVNLDYHFPGGKTIKPSEVKSDFLIWWDVIVADVGAMYPTILRADNIGADTIRLARREDTPDDYVWIKKIPERFLDEEDIAYIEKETNGYLIGIKKSKDEGVVNLAMKGILKMISNIKRELAILKTENTDKEQIKRMQMIYNSLKGIRNAGTHGIMTAPNVSCRQFNLWAGAAITTKGQEILDDVLKRLKNNDIRVVYGDTDGIYVACSKRAPRDVYEILGIKKDGLDLSDYEFITPPEKIFDVIEECNKVWRERLNYPDFELEPERHTAMFFLKHKNYLVWDIEDGNLVMKTKGNNFKASDKAELAVKILEKIMYNVLKNHLSWNDENEEQERVKRSIRDITKDIVSSLNLDEVDISDLIMTQTVSPPNSYARNKDGSMNIFGQRSAALEKIVGRINTSTKYRFVVTRSPLPGIDNPIKSSIKPIQYMYPVDYLSDYNDIDIDWYRKMVKNYIKGAFGFEDVREDINKGKNLSLDLFM
ncbi:MAG: DNA polymerase elongation subunit (family B) [Candidatus Methanoliparum thermophilum]|uniref:DNA polymerase n=1 Tax=Methanoliparum thermophilum TaxID=2491083 RepID=A0A520KSE7_METT2|nr:DNA polymerase domain-containing protein [Candidatus Methanoliparum sp. LAM-1]RZN64847.1 MAG: DNA polymerase elongation subunit (family B) [Candidatus Methanoliparum thermophilum]BDC36281.1 hypothetical protein MTLP_09630 [Candidatus Methanoliparum sp. LAM-1]